MASEDIIKKIELELQKGIKLPKCRKCGCMKEALESVRSCLSSSQSLASSDAIERIRGWLKQMQPIEYSCFGCDYCFAATVINVLNQAFPEAVEIQSQSCNFETKEKTWPVVPGEYFVLGKSRTCPVAVSTLASIELAERLAHAKPKGLCVVGKTETENIGIDKVVKNVITNPAIGFLIIAGKDPQGHRSGKTFLALSQKGVDGDMKVVDAPGTRPILNNVNTSEVEHFRKQVQVTNMIGCEDVEMIIHKIDELSQKASSACECKRNAEPVCSAPVFTVPKIIAEEPKKFKLDKAGYFVIIPSSEKKTIIVEHYNYDNKLLHVIEGIAAPAIYSTIVENGWVIELGHAAYLGRELAKAELSLEHGFKYIQDKAPGKIKDSRK